MMRLSSDSTRQVRSRRPAHSITLARTLHPGAWWVWAIGLAAGASRLTNPIGCLLLLAVAGFVVSARRSRAPWAYAFGGFLKLALLIIVIRIVLQALLSTESQGVHTIVVLPQIPLPSGAAGLKLGGVVTWEAVITAFDQGLQLATIICCIGAANALASAQRLLRCLPGALYEVGVAGVVAMTFAPQLVADAVRVRSALRLRGYDGRSVAAVRRSAMPVLEGALARSVDLAAAMDSRGYGRTTVDRRATRMATAGLVIGGVVGICAGTYGLLGSAGSGWMGLPTLGLGCALAVVGLVVGGRRTGRSRYRPDPWALPEWLVAGSGVAAAVILFLLAHAHPGAAVPPYPLQMPEVPPVLLVGALVGVLPAFLAPPPPDRVVDKGRPR